MLLSELVDALFYALDRQSIIIHKKYDARDSRGLTKQFTIKHTVPNPNYQYSKDKFVVFLASLDQTKAMSEGSNAYKKISSAFRHFRMGESSSSLESRFINYWTALESITRDVFPKRSGDDHRVIEAVVPCIAADYVC